MKLQCGGGSTQGALLAKDAISSMVAANFTLQEMADFAGVVAREIENFHRLAQNKKLELDRQMQDATALLLGCTPVQESSWYQESRCRAS